MNDTYYDPAFEGGTSRKMAATSMILGICSIVCCCLNLILAPLSIVFGVIVLVKRKLGKNMAIAGIATSVVSLVVGLVAFINFGYMIDELVDLSENLDSYVVRWEAYQDVNNTEVTSFDYPKLVLSLEELTDTDRETLMDAIVESYYDQNPGRRPPAGFLNPIKVFAIAG